MKLNFHAVGRLIQSWIGKYCLLVLAKVANLISVKSAHSLGALVGTLVWKISLRRRIALSNLRQAFGQEMTDAQIKAIARAAYRNLGKSLMEFLKLPSLSEHEINRLITLQGTEHFGRALAQGKGVILLAAHFGNWELMGSKMALDGYPLHVIARDQDDEDLTILFARLREHGAMQVINRNQAVRQVLRCLKNNQVVGILADQNTAKGGIFVDFFGKLAATATGPAAFALRTGAPVVPAFCLRKPDDTHLGVIMPPMEITVSGDQEHDIRENTQRLTKLIEEQVRQHPDHWFWVHKRWKTRPKWER